jgi:site-specific DNA recombinase
VKGAALYLRLSRDDGAGESSSISGQRLLLRRWAQEQGLSIFGEYTDDGVSGTTFDRPAFRRMIRDIERGKIDAVLVKDLSRLGRDYITAGQLTELWFPAHGVRFVAVNDGYDSAADNGDMAPLRNIINEMYARDASRKIRSALHARMAAGKFTGSRAPYGYRRSADKSRLEPDMQQAPVVRQIFDRACAGLSCGDIARELNSAAIPSPLGGDWGASTIRKMLNNPVYLGHLAQGRSSRTSLKNKKSLPRPRESWILVENTHEALVSSAQFRLAESLVSVRRPRRGSGFENIFSGLAFCADCGSAMSSVTSRKKGSSMNLACGAYKARGKAACTNHFISFGELCELVLRSLCQELKLTPGQEEEILQSALRKARALPDEKLLRRRLAETDSALMRAYDDFARGALDSAGLDTVLCSCSRRRSTLLAELEDLSRSPRPEAALHLLRGLTYPTELSRDMLHRYVKRIEIHQAVSENGQKRQRVDICWRFEHTQEY